MAFNSENIVERVGIENTSNLTIQSPYIISKYGYWYEFLLPLFDNVIPPLGEQLIAKLIVRDAFMLAVKNNLSAFLDVTGASPTAGVKKVVTGPAESEFFDTAASIRDFMKPNSSGVSPMELLNADICELASRLLIKLQMCKEIPVRTVVPKVYYPKDYAESTTME
jgi:hypothetical protein